MPSAAKHFISVPDLPRRCGAQAEKHVLEATLGQVLAGQQGAAALPAHAQGAQPPGQEVRRPPVPVPPARALSLCVQRLTARQILAVPPSSPGCTAGGQGLVQGCPPGTRRASHRLESLVLSSACAACLL